MKNNGTQLHLRALCEGAVMIAMAQILSWLRLFELPQGGAVCLQMLPVVFYAVRWGVGRGLCAAAAFAVLNLALGEGFIISWLSILGDYIIAFTVYGFAGIFRRRRGGVFFGTVLAAFLQFLSSYITGATVWAEYMPEEFFGATMTSPWLYSALYNGSYCALNAAACIVIFAVLYNPLRRYFAAADLP